MNFWSIYEQKESSRDVRRDTWCVTNEVEYFDWLKKQPVNQVHLTEWTIIYRKVVMSCVCQSPQTCEKNRFFTVQYRCIFVLVIWTLLRELDNKNTYFSYRKWNILKSPRANSPRLPLLHSVLAKRPSGSVGSHGGRETRATYGSGTAPAQ